MKRLFFICLSAVLILFCFCECTKQAEPEKDKAVVESQITSFLNYIKMGILRK